MALLAFLFRLVLFLFAIRLAGIVVRVFVQGFLQGSRSPDPSGGRAPTNRSPAPGQGQIEELVRDPICGVHTARSTAVTGRYQGSTAYFCSAECAAKAS